MKILFGIYSHNDFDHIAPIIWKTLKNNQEIIIINLNPIYNIQKDKKFIFLKKKFKFEYFNYNDIEMLPHNFYDKYAQGSKYFKYKFILKKYLFFPEILLFKFLKKKNIKLFIFDWGSIYCRNRFSFIKYAKNNQVPVIAVPHGMQIFKNPKENNKFSKKFLLKHKQSYNYADAYVFQSKYHERQEISFGLDSKISKVLGSARFDLEWINILKKIYNYKKLFHNNDIIFFLPHFAKNYKTNVKNIIYLLEVIKDKKFNIYIKPHTRYTKKEILDSKFYKIFSKKFQSYENIRLTYKPSFILSLQAKIILYSGSSVFFDGFLLNKKIINLSFIQGRKTFIDNSKKIQNLKCVMSLRNYLNKTSLSKIKGDNFKQNCKIINNLLYGTSFTKKKGYVLNEYYKLIKELI